MKTNRPFNPSGIRTITLTILLLTTTPLLAGIPFFYNKPSDKALMTWLTGKKVTVEKGIIFDSVWTIEAKEFKEFEKLSITKDNQGIYTLHIRFDLYSGDRGLRVYAVLTYQIDKQEMATRFLSCESERVVKMGKW